MSLANATDPRSSSAAWRRDTNPFATCFVRPSAMRYQFADIQSIVDRFRHDPQPTSIVGPHGTGKTTLLAQFCELLGSEFECIERRILHQGEPNHWLIPSLESLASQTLLVVDGAEQLTISKRWRLRMRCQLRKTRLLITSHKPLFGFSVLHHTHTSLQQAKHLTCELLNNSPCPLDEALTQVELIWPDVNGNTRDLWYAMYDWYQIQFVK